jgi:hypothetical protein
MFNPCWKQSELAGNHTIGLLASRSVLVPPNSRFDSCDGSQPKGNARLCPTY